ncbi:hypothetical protein [Xylocopilactobacillus apis]|uniref:DNA-damage-inducible protein J n=1 Tax=Xylocopilactobacillus apis TaxID=2932183 RepID=A0AAU9D8M3_9LACO|nr:hypothetical protein [Xylocopilactobacillus apis]BDR57137.1 hypothetical protein KIMC2_16990 [Xylocopilactobacillus apis]
MSTSKIEISLEDQEKRDLEKNAKAIGLSVSEAIKMMITQFNNSYPINRDVMVLPYEIEKSMLIAKAEEFGLIEDSSEEIDDINTLKHRWLNN